MSRLQQIRVPTLILHGRRDRIAPYELAEETHAGMEGSKMIAFGGGHLFLFFQPEQCTEAILKFLDTVQDPSRG
jgi:pimeloyl-ACP methyl ester carboxylesterase